MDNNQIELQVGTDITAIAGAVEKFFEFLVTPEGQAFAKSIRENTEEWNKRWGQFGEWVKGLFKR